MSQYADLTRCPTTGKLADNIAHFARALRKAGLPIGTGRVIDAIRAVEAAGFTGRTDFYLDLACLLREPPGTPGGLCAGVPAVLARSALSRTHDEPPVALAARRAGGSRRAGHPKSARRRRCLTGWSARGRAGRTPTRSRSRSTPQPDDVGRGAPAHSRFRADERGRDRRGPPDAGASDVAGAADPVAPDDRRRQGIAARLARDDAPGPAPGRRDIDLRATLVRAGAGRTWSCCATSPGRCRSIRAWCCTSCMRWPTAGARAGPGCMPSPSGRG